MLPRIRDISISRGQCARAEQLNEPHLCLVNRQHRWPSTEDRSRFVHFVPCSRFFTQLTTQGGLYYEPLHHDEKSGGIAIKITKGSDGLFNGEPQQVFSYNLDGEQVWYDLSSIFGAPFSGLRLEVTSDSGDPIVWPAGTHPGGSQVKVARSDENVWFTLYGTKK